MKRHYNNGIIAKDFEEGTQPEGFVLGRLPHKNPELYSKNMSAAKKGHSPTFTRKHTDGEKLNISNTLKAKGGTQGSFKKGCTPWNKGLDKSDERVLKSTITYKETMQRLYGCDNYTQSEEYKLRIKVINEKIITTKRRNKSFNISKPEQLLVDYYKKLYGEDDVETQYSSIYYPFNCDIYIKSLDKYIELNGNWTHGGRLFDENDPYCQEQLLKWVEKSSDNYNYFNNAIYTWTYLDVKKVNTAKENNLNYEIVWLKRDKHYFYYSNGVTIKYN